MLMAAYMREGGVKNPQNHAYVIYGCPHTKQHLSMTYVHESEVSFNRLKHKWMDRQTRSMKWTSRLLTIPKITSCS